MNHRVALTLIELLLVLAILASAACMVLPNLVGTQRHMHLRVAAAELADQLRNCRQQAIDHASTICVVFRNGAASYQCFDLHAKQTGTNRELSPGVTLYSLGDPSSAQHQLFFRPDGSACDCLLELRGQYASMMLVVERLTGNVTVGDMP